MPLVDQIGQFRAEQVDIRGIVSGALTRQSPPRNLQATQACRCSFPQFARSAIAHSASAAGGSALFRVDSLVADNSRLSLLRRLAYA